MARYAPPTTRGAARWYTGAGSPSANLGLDGDHYIDGVSGNIWEKTGGAWLDTGESLIGPQGDPGNPGAPGPLWTVGAVPGPEVGLDGDKHVALDGQIYQKVAGAWVATVVDLTGPPGDPGNPGAPGEFTSADVATVAEIRSAAAGKLLQAANIYAAQAPVAVSSGSSIAVDLSTGINFSLTLSTNGTIQNPSNVVVGKSGLIGVTTSGSNRTLGWASNWRIDGGTAPDLSSSSNDLSIFGYFCWSASQVLLFPNGTDFF